MTAVIKASEFKLGELQAKLALEMDANHMKKMVIGMVDSRLGALEAHSAEMIKLQSSSLESLRELHLKASVPIPSAPMLSKADRERLVQEFAKVLE